MGSRGPRTWVISRCLARSFSRELDEKQNSQDSNQCPHTWDAGMESHDLTCCATCGPLRNMYRVHSEGFVLVKSCCAWNAEVLLVSRKEYFHCCVCGLSEHDIKKRAVPGSRETSRAVFVVVLSVSSPRVIPCTFRARGLATRS